MWLSSLFLFVGLMLAGQRGDEPRLASCDGDCRVVQIGGVPVTWGPSTSSIAKRLTFAFAAEPITAGANCGVVVAPAFKNAKSHISDEAFIVAARRAMSRWEAVANVRFEWVGDTHHADVVIGAQRNRHGVAFVDLETKLDRAGDQRRITKAAVCLNDEKRWKIGFDGDLTAFDLEHVLAHELGHVLGLDHPSARGHVMSFRYTEQHLQLTAGDIKGAQFLYGPPKSQAVTEPLAPTSALK